VADEVCAPVAHRQVVFTIPKRLRLHARFDRKLLGKLASTAWACVRAEVQRLLGREDVLPGMVAAIQTHGELLHWHPHIQKCGGRMEVVAFIEPPQQDVIEKILRHCGLWQASSPRPPPGEDSPVRVPDDDGNAQAACCGGRRELTLVPDPSQTLPGDEPWEVTRDACGELFDAAF
jgi:hypothetical protein